MRLLLEKHLWSSLLTRFTLLRPYYCVWISSWNSLHMPSSQIQYQYCQPLLLGKHLLSRCDNLLGRFTLLRLTLALATTVRMQPSSFAIHTTCSLYCNLIYSAHKNNHFLSVSRHQPNAFELSSQYFVSPVSYPSLLDANTFPCQKQERCQICFESEPFAKYRLNGVGRQYSWDRRRNPKKLF